MRVGEGLGDLAGDVEHGFDGQPSGRGAEGREDGAQVRSFDELEALPPYAEVLTEVAERDDVLVAQPGGSARFVLEGRDPVRPVAVLGEDALEALAVDDAGGPGALGDEGLAHPAARDAGEHTERPELRVHGQ